MENIDVALISGGFALGGVVFSRLLDWIGLSVDHKHQKHEKVSAKFEEYADLLNKALQWSHEVADARTDKELNAEPHCIAARRMSILCLLYFHDLEKVTNEFSNVLISYKCLLIDCFDPMVDRDAGTQAVVTRKEEYINISNELIRMRSRIDSKLKELSRKYT